MQLVPLLSTSSGAHVGAVVVMVYFYLGAQAVCRLSQK